MIYKCLDVFFFKYINYFIYLLNVIIYNYIILYNIHIHLYNIYELNRFLINREFPM